MTQLSYKSANELAKMVLDKEISSSELLEYFIKRVESYNPSINAIIVKNYDEARKQARELDEKLLKGEILGALHGVPMTVKESYGVKIHQQLMEGRI